jgi:hypothetical protein
MEFGWLSFLLGLGFHTVRFGFDAGESRIFSLELGTVSTHRQM